MAAELQWHKAFEPAPDCKRFVALPGRSLPPESVIEPGSATAARSGSMIAAMSRVYPPHPPAMIRHSLSGIAVLCLAFASAHAETAKQLLDASGIKGGLVVHLGCGDGSTTMALRANDRYIVHGLGADQKEVDLTRQAVLKAGSYGSISIDRFDGRQLPYVENSVNLIVAEGNAGEALMLAEAKRVLAPLGAVLIKRAGKDAVPPGLVADTKSALPGWTILRKPYPAAMGEWNHFLHGPDNNAVGQDTLAEQPRSIQWVAGPRWARSHEEMASTSIGVTDNGRVFFIVDEAPLASIRFRGQWRLVARDAFNGKLLWKAKIPNWIDHLRHFRAGPVHLQRRLVAADDVVYATLGLAEPVTALDAATGEVLQVYRDTEHTEEILVKDGILYLVIGTAEVKRTGEGLHARDEPEATPFRFIAAVDARSGRTLWRKKFEHSDYLLPLTLTLRGNNVFCQTINGMMRLEAKDGNQVWKTPRATPANRMAFSAPTVVATDEVLLGADHETKEPAKGPVTFGVHGWNIAGFNRKAKCVINAYSVKDGRKLWSAPCAEGYNAPVDVFVQGDIVYVGKNFTGYNLKTGEEVRKLDWSGPAVAMAHPRCHRYKATVKNLFTGRSGIEVASFESGWLSAATRRPRPRASSPPRRGVTGICTEPAGSVPTAWKKDRHSPHDPPSKCRWSSPAGSPIETTPTAAAEQTHLLATNRSSSGRPNSAAH
jgi:outer membrane protein assembly factor BamB